jgi:hypothetical protein
VLYVWYDHGPSFTPHETRMRRLTLTKSANAKDPSTVA